MDLDRLAGLLRTDAVVNMPPMALRFEGRAAVANFFATNPYPGAMAHIRLRLTSLNRQPAYVTYRREPHGTTYPATALVVLTIHQGEIAEITGFRDLALVPILGLPSELGPE